MAVPTEPIAAGCVDACRRGDTGSLAAASDAVGSYPPAGSGAASPTSPGPSGSPSAARTSCPRCDSTSFPFEGLCSSQDRASVINAAVATRACQLREAADVGLGELHGLLRRVGPHPLATPGQGELQLLRLERSLRAGLDLHPEIEPMLAPTPIWMAIARVAAVESGEASGAGQLASCNVVLIAPAVLHARTPPSLGQPDRDRASSHRASRLGPFSWWRR